eukprot:GHRQ01028014.1.p1 GENE.GHRQ01028014.1~~GHRQ01028014.1.p1  ORF type:complete len:103 (+),score=33.62 GHRQ01028014.1:185-493(+)
MALDKSMIAIILAANAIAASVLYQRLDSLGYTVPFKHQLEAVYEKLGIYHAAYVQCGQLPDTMFILTSSRVVHPDGVRPGASEDQSNLCNSIDSCSLSTCTQ